MKRQNKARLTAIGEMAAVVATSTSGVVVPYEIVAAAGKAVAARVTAMHWIKTTALVLVSVLCFSFLPVGEGYAQFQHVRSIDNYRSISEAVTNIAAVETTLMVGRVITVDTNVTVPSTLTLWVIGQGRFDINGGITLTINGPLKASLRQVFSGSGTVAGLSTVHPEWWTTNATPGTTDMTTAFASAISSAGTTSIMKLEADIYLLTDTVTVDVNRLSIIGKGQRITVLKFNPSTTNKVCLHFNKTTGSGIIVQFSLKGVVFDAVGNTQDGKVALRVTDGEEVIIDDIAVANWTSASLDCIGLQFRGRQTHSVSNVTVFCDKPISIEDNPNTTIDINHYHFWNCLLGGLDDTSPIVSIADGVNLSNVIFDGYQAWVDGSDGLKWIDTTTSQSSQDLVIKHVRWKGSTNPTGHMIDIEHNQKLQRLRIEGCSGGSSTLGIKLRNVVNATIANSAILTTSGNALDVDSTVQPLILDNVFAQSGSSVSVGTLKKMFDSGVGLNGGTLSAFVIYALPLIINPVRFDVPIMGTKQPVAQDAAIGVGASASTVGFLLVVTNEDVGAIYFLRGAAGATIEVSDPFGLFTPTKDTASSYNIYFETADYFVQNKRTGSKNIQWLLIASNI